MHCPTKPGWHTKCRLALIDSVRAVKDRPAKWVHIEILDENASVILRVRDSGPRIDDGIQKKLFQQFFTTKPVGQGWGLGLSIVKGILDEHSATIEVMPGDPHTCFEMRFPKDRVKKDAA